MSQTCFIIPKDVLERFAKDRELSDELRDALRHSARLSVEIRKLRGRAVALTRATQFAATVLPELAASPAVNVYDCQHHQTLPGTPVPNPGNQVDQTARRAYQETTGVVDFYKQVFNRNSIDGAGMTLISSIHYGMNYNNAMWNGSQMVYGDGDNQIFVDFTNGNDVIGHELTHGVTQYSLQLSYANDAGGLNESLSDCFGSMFRQWQAKEDVNNADWLIGHDILGPVAKSRKFTCLRNMANPADPKCIAPQPTTYSQIRPGMDPHYSSGPPNLAFCLASKALGGKSWDRVGQIWYGAMTRFGPSPNMRMKKFAGRTRTLAVHMFGSEPAVAAAIDKAWKQVGL
jgi:Zn-dependent metalloprotease